MFVHSVMNELSGGAFQFPDSQYTVVSAFLSTLLVAEYSGDIPIPVHC